MKATLLKFPLLFFSLLSLNLFSQPVKNLSASEIQLALKKLNSVGSVLYIAAHPDDENTRLLAYFANEKLFRTGYLSLTRGDGGQNLIGKEQGELLGLIRTQELLAARRIDGAEQFFTRANDFGYTKNPEETFRFWDHDKVLSDVVWIIRNFQPDIIITRFPTTGEGGHGQHTASAILSTEAFKAAADSKMFPEQLKYVKVWQAKSLWWNTFNFGNSNTTRGDQFHFDAGVYNPLLGKWYGEIAAESRSMHKSQGFGVPKGRGAQIEYFKPLAGDTSCKNIYCNLDFSWKRISGSEKFFELINTSYKNYQPEKPSSILSTLLLAYKELQTIKDDYWRKQKQIELEKIIVACAGLWFEATSENYSVVAGDSLQLKISAVMNSGNNIKINKISFDEKADTLLNKILNQNELFNLEKKIIASKDFDYSTPYWLKNKHSTGFYEVSNLSLIGVPENNPVMNVSINFSINDQTFNFICPVNYKWTDPVQGEKYRSLEIRPVVSLNFSDHTYLFTDDKPKQIVVTARAEKDSIKGDVTVQVPGPFKVGSTDIPVAFTKKGDELKIIIVVTPDAQKIKESLNVSFQAKIIFTSSDKKYNSDKNITEIKYDHIPYQTIFKDAEATLIKIDLNKKRKMIGYIEGAGDAISQCLQQIGYNVITLTDDILENDSLNKYDAIITGVRTYNTNERMQYHYQKLMDYVLQGGNLIVQYNTNNFLSSVSQKIGPYPFKISRDRVTDETAPVIFDKPDHPLLNTPNKITSKDFDNWVQERGLYYPSDIDTKYETILSSSDPGEKTLQTGIITAKYGKGNFIYTSLSFFRELPAGIPGAYRLFVNMIEAPLNSPIEGEIPLQKK